MTTSCSKSGNRLRRSPATMSQRMFVIAQQLWHELVDELRRLNSARLGSDELSRLDPRVRVHAVKAAVAAHHEGISRCC